MPLYRVDYEGTIYIFADSAAVAERDADRFITDDVEKCGPGMIWPPKEAGDVSLIDTPEWLGSIPYGEKGYRTVRQILAAPSPPEVLPPATGKGN